MYYKFSCPVPKEQRPINEYMELVQSNFFNWPVLTTSLYRKKILQAFIRCFIISLPFSSLFFSVFQAPSKFLFLNGTITTILLLFIIIRLLLGWNYIKQRLYNPTIFYEESGWYDGRIWVKSKNILVQDRLIHAYQVLPAIQKLNKALLYNSCLLMFFIILIIFS
jgi:Conserved in the green lineage and diatoms 27